MVRWGQRSSAQCLQCQAELEDKQHILHAQPQAHGNNGNLVFKIMQLDERARHRAMTMWCYSTVFRPVDTGTQHGQTSTVQPLLAKTKPHQMGLLHWWMDITVLAGDPGTDMINSQAQKFSKHWTLVLIKNCGKWHGTCGITKTKNYIQEAMLNKTCFTWQSTMELYQHTWAAQQLPRDALYLLWQPLAVILQYPFKSKQLWLELVQVVQQQHQHHEFDQYLSEQCLMVRWLRSTNQHNTGTNTQPDWGQRLDGSGYIS